MSDLLSFDEIKARFPAEWVLVVDHQTDASLELVAGRVACSAGIPRPNGPRISTA